MIQEKRLVDEFLEFVQVDSESRKEGRICKLVAGKLRQLGAKVFLDDAGKKIGSDGSNIIAKIPGDFSYPAILLNAHLDTVTTGGNVQPVVDGDIIKSDGSTILGADDKAGIAIILEVIRGLREKKMRHPPLDIVFTLAEEIGLLGAKNLDYSLISAIYGYSLDTEYIDKVTTSAPSHNRLKIKIYGVEAHAGAAPERGISAIEVASRAISKLKLGRIDDVTTSNIGKITGGSATNIIAGFAELEGEVRSHNEDKLAEETEKIIVAFKEEADRSKKEIDGSQIEARVEENVSREYTRFYIPDDAQVVKKVISAGKQLGIDIRTHRGGGGSDANIFNERGIQTIVIGTGMQNVHSKNEFIKISDLIFGAKLILEIVKL